jgi:hypothetical protein
VPVEGKTYTLLDGETGSEGYYAEIKRLTDQFLQHGIDEKSLLSLIQESGKGGWFRSRKIKTGDRQLLHLIRKTLRDSLRGCTRNVKGHLKTLPIKKRFDRTLTTKEEQYHRYMVEIELVNRIHREAFTASKYKFALIAHCLRDFRPDCRAEPGNIEAVCRGCTDECLVNLASVLLRKFGIDPYISIEIEQEKLFKQLKQEHASIGALGIACVPELAMGMRLCISLGIPPVGIPLDANRCARWMSKAHETSFNLDQLEFLLQ